MDFDIAKVYGDISIFDGLPLYILPVLPEGFRKALLCVYVVANVQIQLMYTLAS